MSTMRAGAGVALKILPETAVVPQARMLWWPLRTHSGSLTPSGFAEQTGQTGSTRVEPLTETVVAGTAVWAASGGYSVTGGGSAAHLAWTPGDAEQRIFLDSIANLAAFEVGHTLLVGFDAEFPVGYAAAQGTNSSCFLFFGDADSNGWGVETTSAQNLRLHYRAPGSSAVASSDPIGPGDVTIGDGRFRIIVHLECTDVDTFRARVAYSIDGAAPLVSIWANLDALTVNGGTSAPGVESSSGVWTHQRNTAGVGDRNLRRDSILRDVWVARFDGEVSSGLLLKCLQQSLLRPGSLPQALRLYRTDDPGSFDLAPDGNADETFGDILLSDMFVALNGKRSIADHPEFSVEIEPNLVRKNIVLHLQPQWSTDSQNEGLLRIAATPGGWKFRRSEESPASAAFPAYVHSSYRTDQSNRARCESAWKVGENVLLPRGENIWVACLIHADFPITAGGHVTFVQWFHQANGSNLNPPMDLAWFEDFLQISYRTSQVENMVKADQINRYVKLFGKTAELRGTWFDVVMNARIHWDPAEGGFSDTYINGELVDHYEGPIGYKGPTSNGLTPRESLRVGAYPGGFTTWEPDVVRDFWFRRAFVCKDVQGYTLSQIRAALTA